MQKILIVEDMPAELEVLYNCLKKAGYIVFAAANGQEALEKAKLELPDAIVTDLMMPDMGGLELCRHLKKIPETATIPIIACTAKNSAVDRTWAIKQGINAYVTKPYVAKDLLAVIQEVLS
jgi:two-component system, chemotaxis family, response regulator PixH